MIQIDETIFLATRSIWRNKVRSSLTMLGIIIGVSAVILLVALGQGLQSYITEQFEQLGANVIYVLPGEVGLGEGQGFAQGPPNFSGSKLTIEHVENLSKAGGAIKAAAADTEMPATVQYRGESKYTTVAGISEDWSKIVNVEIEKGREFTASDIRLSRNVVILGKSISETLFGRSDPLGKEITIGDEKFEVIGLVKEIGTQSIGFDIDNFVAIPVTSSQQIFGTESIQTIIVQANSQNEIQDAMAETEKYLLQELEDDEFSIVDSSSLLDTINSILSVITAALGGIAAISLVVGGVGIMNIMLVSVTERTREIGLRKAVGAKPTDILMQFLVESVTLSVMGGLIGIGIGWGGSVLLDNFFPTDVTGWAVGLAFGVSAAVGILFGVAPAYRASKLNPIEALRYE